MNTNTLFACACAASMLSIPAASAQVADPTATSGETRVATVHAQGAQVYECAADASGKLAWKFREPIATLFAEGKTVGRHYAGPTWEMMDGSAIVAKVFERADGASPRDIPLLKLEVVSRRGAGLLADVATVRRINTVGGVADGACQKAGAFQSVPYAADYVFYKKTNASSAGQ